MRQLPRRIGCCRALVAALTFGTLAQFPAIPALAQDDTTAAAGKAAYEKRCLRCHTVPQALDFLRKRPDAAERMHWLDTKLTGHHARDPKMRAAIIAFLEYELATENGKKKNAK